MSCKIVGFENGPLEVDCSDAIMMQDGNKLETKNPSYLCRCGKSKNKPFCDGAHSKAGFLSKRDISEEILQTYEGKEISVEFNRSICAGAEACVKGLPSVFKSGDGSNWIFPDEDEKEKIIKTIKRCPSGALSFYVKGETSTDLGINPKVSVIKDGPYNVEGIKLEGFHLPTNFSETKCTLCRCGYSKNKPYCDYSHAQEGWNDEE